MELFIKKNAKIKNRIIILSTLITSLILFTYLINNILSIGFGNWKNIEILYINKENENIKIIKQQYDGGALGYGNYRIAKINNIGIIFNKIEIIDTLKLNKIQWQKVNLNIDERKY